MPCDNYLQPTCLHGHSRAAESNYVAISDPHRADFLLAGTIVGLTFPTPGCSEITGHYENAELTFIGSQSNCLRRFASAGDRPTSTPHLCNLTRYSQKNILACMADAQTISSRKIITAQNLDEAKTAAYTNDPKTELVILGLSENASVTTCGWARHFFDSRATGF